MRVPARLLLAVAVALATALAYRSLLGGLALEGHDHLTFYVRVQQYAAELANGHWPQDLPDAFRGAGHAFPRFYPPLSHWAALAFLPLTGDPILATHLAVFAAVVVAGTGAGAVVMTLTGDALAALVAGVAYAQAPYVQLTVFQRGAFGEVWGLAWYPIVALGVARLRRGARLPAWWPLALAAAVLSHAVMALWTLPVLVLAALVVAPPRDRRDVLAAVAIGALLCAFWVVPVEWYKAGVRVTDPTVMWATPEDLARQAGLLPFPGVLPLVEGALLVACVAWIVRARRRGAPLPLPAVPAALHAVFAMLPAAPVWFWAAMPMALRYVQFPFRLHGPAAFFGALALGLAAARARHPRWRAAWLACVPAFVLNAAMMERPHGHGFTRATLPRAGAPFGDRGVTAQAEYLPAGTTPETMLPTVLAARARLDAAGDRWTREGGDLVLRRTRPQRETLVLPLLAYDFHDVRDGAGRALPTAARDGLLTVSVDDATAVVRVGRRLTPPVIAGFVVSALGVLLLLVRARRNATQARAPDLVLREATAGVGATAG